MDDCNFGAYALRDEDGGGGGGGLISLHTADRGGGEGGTIDWTATKSLEDRSSGSFLAAAMRASRICTLKDKARKLAGFGGFVHRRNSRGFREAVCDLHGFFLKFARNDFWVVTSHHQLFLPMLLGM